MIFLQGPFSPNICPLDFKVSSSLLSKFYVLLAALFSFLTLCSGSNYFSLHVCFGCLAFGLDHLEDNQPLKEPVLIGVWSDIKDDCIVGMFCQFLD
jgi:hypothetical protein